MFNRQALIGLIGANIMKSLAPALHIDAFAAAGITGHYHLMDVDQLPGRTLESLLNAVKTAGFLGVNITFPFKQAVMPLLDELSPEARQTGAVNTVTISRDGLTTGYNTDRSGFRLNFEDGLGHASAEGKTAVLVGAGGAGSAVAFALMDLGLRTLVVHDTDPARAASLAEDVRRHFGAERCRVSERLSDEIVAADGVANATPIGMTGFPGNPVPVDALRIEHWVADVIYTPIETELIRTAAGKGAQVLTGGGMCVYQGVDAFRLFTGITPDVARMHRTFAAALAARDAALLPPRHGPARPGHLQQHGAGAGGPDKPGHDGAGAT
jgi:shikimate dehydrogenase